MEQLFMKTLDIYHQYLLFTASLRKHATVEEIKNACQAMSFNLQSTKDNFYLSFNKFPDLLNFLYSLSSKSFQHNPYYTEILYSCIDCIISASLPYPQLIEFLHKMITNTEKLTFQDLVLLNSVCNSSIVMEAVTATKEGEILSLLYQQMIEEKNLQLKLGKLFSIYVLCKESKKNKTILEEIIQTINLANSLCYNQCNEMQQLLILSLFHNLAATAVDPEESIKMEIDLSVLTPTVDTKDIELSTNIRNEIRSTYEKLISSSETQILKSTGCSVTKLLNIFALLLLDSSPSIQVKVIDKL